MLGDKKTTYRDIKISQDWEEINDLIEYQKVNYDVSDNITEDLIKYGERKDEDIPNPPDVPYNKEKKQ